MKNTRAIIISLVLFLLAGCNGIYYSKKDSETLSRGTYAVRDSLVVSRVDLAKKYSDETIRIVVPPKNPIKIEGINKTSQDKDGNKIVERVVILPESAPINSIRVNSDEFKELLKDKHTLENYTKGEAVWKDYSDEVELRIREEAVNSAKKEELIKNQETQIRSLVWYRNIVWSAISIVGVGVLLYILSLLIRAGIIGAKIVS
jgi:hypothetical protein